MTTAGKETSAQLLSTHKATVTSLENLLRNAAADSQKQGYDHLKISGNCEYEMRLVVENKSFTLANSLRSQSLHVEVHKDQKKGSSSVNILDAKALEHAIKQATTLANFSVADQFLTMADKAQAPTAKPLSFLWDDRIADIDLQVLQEAMQAIMARMCSDKRVAIDRFETSISLSHSALANSLGVFQSEGQSTVDWSYMGMAREGDEVSGMDYDSGFSYQNNNWLDACLKEADIFREKVIASLTLVDCPSYKGPVIFSPRAVEDILWSVIGFHTAGRAVMDGKSRWQDSLGKQIFSKEVTFIDQAHHPQLSGSSAFDADGVPTQQQVLIKDGVLKQFVHDLYSAKRCKTKTNAMAGGPFGITMAGGSTPLAGLLKARAELLYVDRFSGNVDPLTGQFSGVAKSSKLYSQGASAGNVNETMIAGNIFDIAMSLQASKETEIVSGGAIVPTILLDGISVTGA